MTFFELSVMVTITGTLLVCLVYFYFYILYREYYMGIWVLSWMVHFLRLILIDITLTPQSPVLSLIFFQLNSILTGTLLVWGTHVFLGHSLKKWWVSAAIVVTIVSNIALYFDLAFLLKTFPTALLFGFMFIWTGVMVIQYLQIKGLGKYITGGAFIILGLHAMDFPFFILIAAIAPWGYLLDAVLRIIIAFGTLLIYFEKTRLDLINKEKYYRLMMENALDIIYRYRFTPKPAFEYVSPAVIDITGYTAAEYYQEPELECKIVHPDDRELLNKFRDPSSFTDKSVEFRLFSKDGALIWIEQRGVPVYNETGQLIAFEGIIRDITERRRVEQAMHRLDGLHAVGQMAANLAHEIRNPMTTIRGYLQLLGNRKEFNSYKEEFELLLEELDRTNSIITEYLALSKQKASDFNVCQLNKIVKAIFPLIQADANASSKCVKLDLATIPELYLDEKEIRQLLLNLVRNGLEAMEAGRTLTIQTMLNEDTVILAVKDQGNGIPVEVLDKIGTPFLTTKEQGTGLGLPVCYSIANRHQATIEISTSLSGTTFYIRFPFPNSNESKEKLA